MEIQQAYKQKMATQLKEWNAQIDLLEAKVENAGADIAVKRAEALQELRAKQRVAAEKMLELEKSSGEAWGQVKETADKVWEDLKAGVAEAHNKFR
jgi:outer membrane murein-binding lipoprotein Lpp